MAIVALIVLMPVTMFSFANSGSGGSEENSNSIFFHVSNRHNLPNNVYLNNDATEMRIVLTTGVSTELILTEFFYDPYWENGLHEIEFVSNANSHFFWNEVSGNLEYTSFLFSESGYELFRARASCASNRSISVITDSWDRGVYLETYLIIENSLGERTSALRIVVVIGNDPPRQIVEDERNILRVAARQRPDGQINNFFLAMEVNILDHVVDRNPMDMKQITSENPFAIRIVPFSAAVAGWSGLIYIQYDRTRLVQTFRISVSYDIVGVAHFRIAVRDGGTVDMTHDVYIVDLFFTVYIENSIKDCNGNDGCEKYDCDCYECYDYCDCSEYENDHNSNGNNNNGNNDNDYNNNDNGCENGIKNGNGDENGEDVGNGNDNDDSGCKSLSIGQYSLIGAIMLISVGFFILVKMLIKKKD